MTAITVIIAVTTGLLLGPWLRGAIFRHAVVSGEPDRRNCPSCARVLLPAGPLGAVYPVTPTGRCPACHQRFGMPPTVVELMTAGLLGLLALRVHPFLVLAALAWMAAAGIVLAAIDASKRRLPDAILAPTLVGVVALLIAAGLVDHRPHQLLQALISGAAAFAAFTLLALATSGLGFGDCKLAALLGVALGWFSWRTLFAGITLGFLLAALYLLPRMMAGRSARSERIAFGPFMLMGALIILLVAA